MNASNENAGFIGINTPRNQHKRFAVDNRSYLPTIAYCSPVLTWLLKSVDNCQMTGLSAETAWGRNLQF